MFLYIILCFCIRHDVVLLESNAKILENQIGSILAITPKPEF